MPEVRSSKHMEEPIPKRQRTDGDDPGMEAAPEDLVPPPPPPGDPEPDAVTVALTKLKSHMGNARKFPKAAGLLRQLFANGNLITEHGPAVFAALRAAMADPSQADQPELRKEYTKLFTAASKAKHLFSTSELTELDVYGLWAVLRPQLATDDSFQFNRVVGVIKQHVAALPEASANDDAIMAALQARLHSNSRAGKSQHAESSAATATGGFEQQVSAAGAAQGRGGGGAAAAASQGGAAAAENGAEVPQLDAQAQQGGAGVSAEADPFGIDQVLQQQQAQEVQQAAAAAWTPEEATCMRRAALLDCFDSMKEACSRAWAQLSVEIAIEELVKHRGSFGPAQQPRITALHTFAKDQRTRRQRGPSAKEKRRDTTAFEAARKDWSSRTVSARGTIMTGDHKTETWLG